MSGSCVPVHALLSALATRVEREAFVPDERDLSALLALGVAEADIAGAFDRIGTEAATEAARVLGRVVAARRAAGR